MGAVSTNVGLPKKVQQWGQSRLTSGCLKKYSSGAVSTNVGLPKKDSSGAVSTNVGLPKKLSSKP